MSLNTDKLNQTESAKKNGFIFLDLDQVIKSTSSYYSMLYVAGIAISYLLISINIVPMVYAGTITMTVYCLIHLSTALAWLGIGHLIKKYKLQHALIVKGEKVGE